MTNIEKYNKNHFEEIKETDKSGGEYWSARKLSKVLGYAEYRNFLPVIKKAIEACKNSNQKALDHFVEMHDMVKIGSGAERKIEDINLSRYACKEAGGIRLEALGYVRKDFITFTTFANNWTY